MSWRGTFLLGSFQSFLPFSEKNLNIVMRRLPFLGVRCLSVNYLYERSQDTSLWMCNKTFLIQIIQFFNQSLELPLVLV